MEKNEKTSMINMAVDLRVNVEAFLSQSMPTGEQESCQCWSKNSAIKLHHMFCSTAYSSAIMSSMKTIKSLAKLLRGQIAEPLAKINPRVSTWM